MKYPNHFTVSEIMGAKGWPAVNKNGVWVPARPVGYPSLWNRVRLAWIVFTGRGDVVSWTDGH